MTVEELRQWLSIEPGTLDRTCDLTTRVIEQARRELNEKASLTFIAKPVRHGRKTVGWFFEIKDNKPKQGKKLAGSVALPEAAKQAQIEQSDLRVASAKCRWEQADSAQQHKWLEQMNGVARAMAPQDGAEPRPFSLCLGSLLEPELPLT